MRHVTTTKKEFAPVKPEELSIVLLNSTSGKALKYPRCNAFFRDGETLLVKQVNIIKAISTKIDICVLTGEQNEDIYNNYNHSGLKVRYIENERFFDTNEMRSLCLALRSILNPNVLVIHGDTMFSHDSLFRMMNGESSLGIDSKKTLSENKIGVIIDDGKVSTISYGLPDKWSQLAMFTGEELSQLKALAYNKAKWNWYIHESISHILHNNGSFKACETEILEINNRNDIEKVNTCLK